MYGFHGRLLADRLNQRPKLMARAGGSRASARSSAALAWAQACFTTMRLRELSLFLPITL